MGIVNYEKVAASKKRRVYRSKKISAVNMERLEKFLLTYNVSPARMAIFLERIQPLLEEFDDVKEAITNEDQVERYFKRIRDSYSAATFETYLSVTKLF